MPRLQLCLALVLFSSTVQAADWPQWRGPNRDGASTEKVAAWKEAPARLWSVRVGEGHSSPIVAGGRYISTPRLTARTTRADRLRCRHGQSRVDEDVSPRRIHGSREWPRAHPVCGGTSSIPMATGTSLFRAPTATLLGKSTRWTIQAPNLKFGISGSPLVEGDKVIVSVGKGASVVAWTIGLKAT